MFAWVGTVRWARLKWLWFHGWFSDEALCTAVPQCFIPGLGALLYHVSMAINHFRGLGWPNILSQHHHWRQVELIEKKLWKRREGGKKPAHSICRAWLRTLERRLNTGYQIWTQNKSLSSSSSSHSFSDGFPWAACILCITRSNLQWTADSVKAPNPDIQNYYSH